VHAGVQRLHAPVEALREPGELLHRRDRHARLGDPLRRRPRRDDLDTERVQARGQLGEPALVVHADQGPAYGAALGHGMVTSRPVTVAPSRASAATVPTSSRRSSILMRSCSVSTVSPGSTGTAAWASTGPVSTPSSTMCTVAPVTFTP